MRCCVVAVLDVAAPQMMARGLENTPIWHTKGCRNHSKWPSSTLTTLVDPDHLLLNLTKLNLFLSRHLSTLSGPPHTLLRLQLSLIFITPSASPAQSRPPLGGSRVLPATFMARIGHVSQTQSVVAPEQLRHLQPQTPKSPELAAPPAGRYGAWVSRTITVPLHTHHQVVFLISTCLSHHWVFHRH